MDKLIPTIGMEVHAQVKSKSKIFCRCSAEWSSEPNTNVCPICMGYPGVMPAINKEVVKKAVIAALALNCRVNFQSGFARKNYFYPDLPKGYQITQFRHPLASEGYVNLSNKKKIRIRRLHLEEDTGKMIHDQDEETLIDFNRAGVPLIEIVTEPDFETAEEAVEYMSRIREILKFTGVSDANMEMGELRGEPNISIRREHESKLGVKTEIKNLNSLRSIERGINFEIARQRSAISEGKEIVSQTMLYNEKKQEALPMRKKESASEYRYFIEPDLPDLLLSEEFVKEAENLIGELPEKMRERMMRDYNIGESEAYVLTSDKKLAEFFEKSVESTKKSKKIINFFIREIPARLNEKSIETDNIKFKTENLRQLFIEIESDSINLNSAQDVLNEMAETGDLPEIIINRRNLRQSNDDGEARKIVEEVLCENPNEVKRYKSGEEKLFGVLVGFCMKKANKRVSPAVINKILKEILK